MFVAALPPGLSSRSARPAWHAVSADSLWIELGTSPEGLSEEQAAQRLAQTGPNRLPPAPGVSALAILLAQLRSIVVLLLVAAVIISVILGDLIEAGAIGAVLVINTLLGFVTEWRARRAMEALLQLQATRVAVLRNGQLRVVDAETGELHPRLSDGQRAHDLDIAQVNIAGELMDLEARGFLTEPDRKSVA